MRNSVLNNAENPLNTCQNKGIYKHYISKYKQINSKYIIIWLGTFKYNCTRVQLSNEGGRQLHKIKRSRDKTKIGKEVKSDKE